MLTIIGFAIGTVAGSVLALPVYCELLACRRRKAAAERREAVLRAVVHALEEQAEERMRAEADRLRSSQWLPREVCPEVHA